MELREAIDKLFEMTDEQRSEIFGISEVKGVLDNHYMTALIENIEDFYSEPKYGDVYVHSRDGHKIIILDGDFILSDKYECPQEMSFQCINGCYTKTGKNVADKLKGLFK